MALSNHERVGKALELLNDGLKPFILREMQVVYGPRAAEEARNSLRDGSPAGRRSGELAMGYPGSAIHNAGPVERSLLQHTRQG